MPIDAWQAGNVDVGEGVELDRILRLVAKRHTQLDVHVEAPGERPVHHSLEYLARYLHRVVLSDARMLTVSAKAGRLPHPGRGPAASRVGTAAPRTSVQAQLDHAHLRTTTRYTHAAMERVRSVQSPADTCPA